MAQIEVTEESLHRAVDETVFAQAVTLADKVAGFSAVGPQIEAIVDGIEERLLELGAKPTRREGEQEGRWVLLDYLDIVVHVQHSEEREYYLLEKLWKDCPRIELPETVTGGRA